MLDSGAVIALSRRKPRARALLAAAREAGADVSVPSVVVAETVRGTARAASVNRVLNAVGDVRPADERTGRIAGGLLGSTGSDATIDAIVAATTIDVGGGVIATGDPDDLTLLTADHPEIVVHAV